MAFSGNRRIAFGLGVLLALCGSRVAPADSPASQPATEPGVIHADVSAAELVRDVRQSEAWIDHVKSFSMKVDSVWTRSPESVELRKSELKKQFPRLDITEARFPDLRARATDTMIIGFEPSRLVKRTDREGDSLTVQIWDGKEARGRSQYFANKQDGFWFDKEPTSFSGGFFESETSWPRAARHHYWWTDPKQPSIHDESPEAYEIIGRETYRGIDCWVLNQGGYNFARWYVGVADHLLHGLGTGTLKDNPALPTVLKSFGDEHQQSFSSAKDVFQWTRTLPADQREIVYQEFLVRLHRTDHPFIENWVLDYKEVQPGKLFPMTQGYVIRRGDFLHPIEQTHREISISDVKVDEPLPDQWFVMEMQEGVRVFDRRSDPPLIYKYKKEMTDAEWEKIRQDALQRKMDELARQKAQDVALNKAPPDFPAGGQWLNSKPLSWSDFKGKLVVVDFFAEWCGPCRNDYPTLVQLHQQADKSGIIVIGIHAPGSPKDKIDRLLSDFKISYPVFVDVPAPPGVRSWGTIFNSFGVTAIPHSFLVDDNGQVVAHGTLGSVLAKARELNAAKQRKVQ